MNANVTLKRAEVAEKYESPSEADVVVHCQGYSGKLSNINLSGAEHLVKSKSPLLKERAAPAKEKSTPANKSN